MKDLRMKTVNNTEENRGGMSLSPWRVGLIRFAKNRLAVVSLVVVTLILLACIFAPALAPADPYLITLGDKFAGISLRHPFGADGLGRDMLSRMLYGGRLTFKITFMAVFVSLAGLVIGVASGYVGGWFDLLFSRLSDGLSAIPTFLTAMVLELTFGWGKGYFMYALGIAMMPPLMRLARNLTIEVKSSEYIEASRALGVSHIKIICNHILRNIAPQLVVHVAGSVGDAMINCTMLGYLGVGVTEPTPEWGNVIRSGYAYILTAPQIIGMSCAVVGLTILGFAIIGNGLRDALAAGSKED